ncbi:retron St85 family RNA-directed DNA polymerase [Stenotrophomonas maltophilia]|uniref:retron St85 family RNA-directed DNA polymerase n=1 Tax=Stenotrophomonas maltophilia TaxID=40324 RepID=UPI0009B2BA72|nr:retron St85 family RNA-directed DNA polymerase [Stenotrophomonas maltophilia]
MTTGLIQMLSQRSGLPQADIERIVASAPRRYKEFTIPKRNGRGLREIAQPSRELKLLQRIIVDAVLSRMPVHESAHGYVVGRGIRTNAAAHARSSYILKMDFRDFFPSLVPLDLRSYLQMHHSSGFTEQEVRQLEQILFWRKKGSDGLRMCIGAPSSPALSNALMYDLDRRISNASSIRGVTYTRYADDLTFSTRKKDVLGSLLNEVIAIVGESKRPCLRINASKTISISRAQRRTVTGVNVTPDGKLSIGRENKRLIRSMVNHHVNGKLSQEGQARLIGLIGFAADIEPDFSAKMRIALLNSPPLLATPPQSL